MEGLSLKTGSRLKVMDTGAIENKIIGIYGSLQSFSQATGISVPKVCQAITGKIVLSEEEQVLFDNALNIDTGGNNRTDPGSLQDTRGNETKKTSRYEKDLFTPPPYPPSKSGIDIGL